MPPIARAPTVLTEPPSRISGPVASANSTPRPSASYGTLPQSADEAATLTPSVNGTISLNFADTDIRTVVDQILAGILHVNYTIDPSVSGTVTLRTVTPLTRDALIPTLQTLLAQHNAVLVQSNDLYRIMPADQASAPALAADAALGGASVLPLRYTSAPRLAALLKPYITKGGSIIADPDRNALVIQGDPPTRSALTALVQAFDVDALANQSYELFPVTDGNAQDFAGAFSAALTKQGDTEGAHAVTVIPLQRISAVLVIARAQSYLGDATRVYEVLNQVQRETVRSWHVLYLRNSRANDAAYLLQQAFTPDNVTAQPTLATSPAASGTPGSTNNAGGSAASTSAGITGSASSSDSNGAGGLLGTSVTNNGSAGQASGTGTDTASPTTSQGSTAGASALLGPLSATSSSSAASCLHIIPDNQNNALLVDATPQEEEQIEGVLAKVDIMPLEVRIDATIAEVDLTGALQYGTQFFFKSGGINAVLSTSTSDSLATNFPGFVLSGHGSDAAPLAISALQSVTKVRVLSSPELMVLDGQAANLQVGDLVPYLTQTSQDTTVAGAPVINSIDYRETGVILRVTPHVGSGGLVTLDVAQEISGVSPTVTTAGINSPTFTERAVTSRVAIQDGQTVGLAGLISDNDSHDNQGIPFLKNIPLLGALLGSQNNNRSREETLVLITPHVITSQQQALDLTADLEEHLPNAAQAPDVLQATPVGGSADPNAALAAAAAP